MDIKFWLYKDTQNMTKFSSIHPKTQIKYDISLELNIEGKEYYHSNKITDQI